MFAREKMIEELLKAEKYPLGGSYSPKTLSKNVKLYNLNLTEEQEEMAGELLIDDIEGNLFNYLIEKYSELLLRKTHGKYELDVRGRNGGHIVMIEVESDDNGYKLYKGNGFLNGYVSEEYFEDFENYEIEEFYNTMLAFNDVTDKLIEEFKRHF